MFPLQQDRNQEDCNFFSNFIPHIEITMNFSSQKLARTYYQCLESAITTHFGTLQIADGALIGNRCLYYNWRILEHRVHFDVVGQLLKATVESWDSVSNFPRLVLQPQVEWLILGRFRFWVWRGSANQPLPPQQT